MNDIKEKLKSWRVQAFNEVNINSLGDLLEKIKEMIMKLFTLILSLFSNAISNHSFSILFLVVWSIAIYFIDIPSNWHDNWRNIYYFIVVIGYGFIFFVFEYEHKMNIPINVNNKNLLSKDDLKSPNITIDSKDIDSIKKTYEESIKAYKTKQKTINQNSIFNQTKNYFKYLGIILAISSLFYIGIYIFNTFDNGVKLYIAYGILCLLLLVVIYALYGISSKRKLLKPAWASTNTAVETLEKIKYRENNKPENKGFILTRILTRPFLFIYYFVYVKYCNFKDFIERMRDENKRRQYHNKKKRWYSKNKTYVIIITICSILLYFQYFHSYLNTKLNLVLDNKIVLQTEPIHLGKKTIVGPKDILFGDSNKDSIDHPYTYSISLWVYIENSHANHNLMSNQNSIILDYGEVPKFVYNVKTKMLSVFLKHGKNSTVSIYETNDLPLQKWNHFVFNYDHGTMDVFQNGMLVGTSKDIVPIMMADDIYVGDTNGIRGAVRDIVFSMNSRSQYDIYYEYYKDKLGQYLK